MASIRARTETGHLVIDFRYRGKRCREQTLLIDTPENRKRLERLVDRMERAMLQGTFVYEEFFPGSPLASIDRIPAPEHLLSSSATTSESQPVSRDAGCAIPCFAKFANLWFEESKPRWRKRNEKANRDLIANIFNPHLGEKSLHEITRADLLGFRAVLCKRPGRGGQLISGKRVNKIMSILASILNEGCDRYGITSPSRGVKPLKQKRSEVLPFSLTEVNALITRVRDDYRAYLVVRLLTGLRTGEVNGLQWSDIDLEEGQIHIERTYSRDGDGDTKTELSRRTIPMVPAVHEALVSHQTSKLENCPWVFHSAQGNPIDANNFANRIWYPLLRFLGFKKRPPYQMRHTAATLMLAAGENPEWVAQILGHSTTEMLFRVYSRFVPNLTRNDGGAYAGLLNSKLTSPKASSDGNGHIELAGMSLTQKRALLQHLASELDMEKSR
jgi:integrase